MDKTLHIQPDILNPSIINPSIINPSIINSSILSPPILNPAIITPSILNPSILNPSIINHPITNPVILMASDYPTQPATLTASASYETQTDTTQRDTTVNSFINTNLFNSTSTNQETIKLEDVEEPQNKKIAHSTEGDFSQGNTESIMHVVKEESSDKNIIWPEQYTTSEIMTSQASIDSANISFATSFKVDPFSPPHDSTTHTGDDSSGTIKGGFMSKETGGPMDTAEISSLHEFNHDITQCILNEPLFPILLNSNIDDATTPINPPSPHTNTDHVSKSDQDYNIMLNDEAQFCNIQESLCELKNLAQQVEQLINTSYLYSFRGAKCFHFEMTEV